MAFSINLGDIDLIRHNDQPAWASKSGQGKQIIPAEGRPGALSLRYGDLTLDLKHAGLMAGGPVKIGSICFNILGLIQQRRLSYLFSYDERSGYVLEIERYDFGSKTWHGSIRPVSGPSA
ncbi:MAG: hypothetical protein H0W78_13130 [Planctomycetes bacterium]|nr:hypothetical protein [Planctomycetota bacterium]MBA3964549.1 hypothetical protein [Nitrospirales bacterium]